MKANLYLVPALLLSLLVTNTYADEAVFNCPDKVRLASGIVVAEDVPSEYQPLISERVNRLTGVSAFDGPPKDGAILKPLIQKREQIKWIFEGAYEKGKWVSCDYADGLIRLVQQVPNFTSVCIATIKNVKPYHTLTGIISCK